ncbi:MAG: hydantoinase/oxoprolinase family protein, partial [Myxococcota bacterium]|nr:hydantoinase/oxoprolinase family protein [Myxococcota bacterium]
MTPSVGWHVAMDRGGTFTDVVARDPQGRLHLRKALALEGEEARVLQDLMGEDALQDLVELRLGTTVGTNALLTGQGGRTALLVTAGFEDLLLIGDQRRPDLFGLDIRRLPPLYEQVIGVSERVLADGHVRGSLDLEELQSRLVRLREQGIEGLAIAFAHAHRFPDHEESAGRLATQLGFDPVVLSCRSSPGIGYLIRAETALADAFVRGPLERYTSALRSDLPDAIDLLLMKSSGGLSRVEVFRGIDSVFSGPAGGAVACGRVARELGLPAVLGFDMGGTSTDVCRWAGEPELRQVIQPGGRELRVPSLDIVTVAAGGGSLLTLGDQRFQVGPESAGADPGPACYGRGGPAALSDANLVLGRLQPDLVPAVFGTKGGEALSLTAAEEAIAAASGGEAEEVAAGFVAIANARMAAAIAELSTARGHDPAGHSLVGFGGAAGQHVCGVAGELGIRHVVLHPLGSLLSAQGISVAQPTAIRSATVLETWDSELPGRWKAELDQMAKEAEAELGLRPGRRLERWFLRYQGAQVPISACDQADFEDRHERLFGFRRPDQPVEALRVEVEVQAESEPIEPDRSPPIAGPLPRALRVRRVGFPGRNGACDWRETPVYLRSELRPGQRGAGPLLVVDPSTTVVVDPGWAVEVGAEGLLELRRSTQERGEEGNSTAVQGPQSVRLELFFARFMSLCTRMGERLRQVAWSVNIKERLDFSCALFDAGGFLVSNAPHIPVHLGAMGETVRGLMGRQGDEVRPGRSWAVNDPFKGGSHLPDITVITPVFLEGRLFAWVANRGHHADVGGSTPGSMPPASSSLEEEGVVLDDLLLVEGGRLRREAIFAALAASDRPARDPETTLGDL